METLRGAPVIVQCEEEASEPINHINHPNFICHSRGTRVSSSSTGPNRQVDPAKPVICICDNEELAIHSFQPVALRFTLVDSIENPPESSKEAQQSPEPSL